MTDEDIDIRVRLSCQRAMLGAITPNLRLITIGWEALMVFRMVACFQKPPTEDEADGINTIATEVLADIDFQKSEVQCLHTTAPLKDLPSLKWIIFARKEI